MVMVTVRCTYSLVSDNATHVLIRLIRQREYLKIFEWCVGALQSGRVRGRTQRVVM